MNTAETVQLVLVMSGLLSMLLVWASALEYSGRTHFNERLLVLAAQYTHELWGEVSLRDVLIEQAKVTVGNALSSNPWRDLMNESDISWMRNIQVRAKQARTEEQWQASYDAIARLARDSVEIGRPLQAVNLRFTEVADVLGEQYRSLLEGHISTEQFLAFLRSATKMKGYLAWRKEVSGIPEDIRPSVWAVGWPETIVFLDHVGRGTAFGLFVGIFLSGGLFATDISSLSALGPVVAGLAGGVIHGASVHRRLRVHQTDTGGRYSQWAKQNLLGEYILGLIMIGVLATGFTLILNFFASL